MADQDVVSGHQLEEPAQSHLPIVEIGQVGQCVWTFGLLWLSPSTVSGVSDESRSEAELTGADVYGVARYETRAQYALGKLPEGVPLPKKRSHLAGAFVAAQVTAQTGVDNWIGAIRITLSDQGSTSFWWLVEVQNGELVPKGDQISDDEQEVRETLMRRTSRVSFRAVYCPEHWHLPGEEVRDQVFIAGLLSTAPPLAISAFRLYSRGRSTWSGFLAHLVSKFSRMDGRQKLLLGICLVLGVVVAMEVFSGDPGAVAPPAPAATAQPDPQGAQVQALPMEIPPPPPRLDPVAGSADPQQALLVCWRAMSTAPAYLAGARRQSLSCRIDPDAAVLIAQFDRSQHPQSLVSALAAKRGFDGQEPSGAWTMQIAGADELGERDMGSAASMSDTDLMGWVLAGDLGAVDGYRRSPVRATVSVPAGSMPTVRWPPGFVLRLITRQEGSANSVTLEIEGDTYVDTLQ